MTNLIFKSCCLLLIANIFNPMAALAYEGTSFEAAYTAEYWSNIKGGIKQESAYLDILDLTMEVDTEQAFGISKGKFFAYLFYTNDTTLSDKIIGDGQTASNIDNDEVIRLMEFWYEHQISDENSVKIGLYDLNSEFDAIETAGLFVNSSHGIGPDYSQSGEAGPSIFPSGSLGIRYLSNITDAFSYQIALLDAVPGDPNDSQKNTIQLKSEEGALVAAELNYKYGNHRYGTGSWYYTEDIVTVNGLSTDVGYGIYGIFEAELMNATESEASLNSFIRLGMANESTYQVAQYLGAGLVYANFLQSRPSDSIGIAIAHAKNGSSAKKLANLDSSETNIEITYQSQVSERILIQPDLQYIINPGSDSTLDDSISIGIRAQFTFY